MIFWFSSHMSLLNLWAFSLIDPYLIIFISLLSLSWEVFHQRYDCLGLISFLTGLGCSHWSSGFLLQFLIIRLGGFSSSFHSSFFLTIPRSAQLAFEEKSNCKNIIFGIKVMWQLLITTLTHLVWLLSWRSVPLHLSYKVGGMSIYKLKEYFIATDTYQVWNEMTKESKESW